MKDNRFIELLNLYVDRQITAGEAAELEAELQNNPRRQAVYRQYCQMHRATALVYESFRANSSSQAQTVEAGSTTVARFDSEHTRRRTPWIHYAGGLIAACLAVAFVARSDFSRPADGVIVASRPHTQPVALAATVPPPAVQAKPAPAAEARNDLVSLRNASLVANQDYAAMLLALRREEQRAVANGQIQTGRIPSLFDDGVFDSNQFLPANNRRIFRPAQTPTQPAEFTAFQFQR